MKLGPACESLFQAHPGQVDADAPVTVFDERHFVIRVHGAPCFSIAIWSKASRTGSIGHARFAGLAAQANRCCRGGAHSVAPGNSLAEVDSPSNPLVSFMATFDRDTQHYETWLHQQCDVVAC